MFINVDFRAFFHMREMGSCPMKGEINSEKGKIFRFLKTNLAKKIELSNNIMI